MVKPDTAHEGLAAAGDAPAATSILRVSWAHVIPSLIGIGLSVYSLYLHHEIKTTGSSGCGFTETINCDKVLGSRFGEFMHIPLGGFGLVFFLIVLVLAVTTQPPSADRGVARSRVAVASGGLLVSITLTAISFAAIHAA